MDGVLCDFDKQCRYYFDDLKDSETLTEYKKRIGEKRFWHQIRATNGEFWSTMEPLAEDVVEVWRNMEVTFPHIAILSSPDHRDPMCIPGKHAWLDRHLGPRQLRLFQSKKFTYACPQSVLVDDQLKNIIEWEAAGGTAIHFQGVYDDDFWSQLNQLGHNRISPNSHITF